MVSCYLSVVSVEDLTIMRDKIIGNGSFGSVFKGKWKGKPCAAKVLNALGQQLVTSLPVATGEGQSEALIRFKKECEFMKQLKHPNVVEHYATLLYPNCKLPILVMELMEFSLRNYMRCNQHISMKIQISLGRDVAAALEFLHEKDIVHRDLCPDNILLNHGPVAKVSDFGMSRIITKYGHSLTHSLTALGRRGFMPPESSSDYDSSVDIFMFGVVMTMIVSNISNVENKEQRTSLLQRISDRHPLKSVIKSCLNNKKEERPNASEVHELLKEKGITIIISQGLLYFFK